MKDDPDTFIPPLSSLIPYDHAPSAKRRAQGVAKIILTFPLTFALYGVYCCAGHCASTQYCLASAGSERQMPDARCRIPDTRCPIPDAG